MTVEEAIGAIREIDDSPVGEGEKLELVRHTLAPLQPLQILKNRVADLTESQREAIEAFLHPQDPLVRTMSEVYWLTNSAHAEGQMRIVSS